VRLEVQAHGFAERQRLAGDRARRDGQDELVRTLEAEREAALTFSILLFTAART
jgi:hypothetical protein